MIEGEWCKLFFVFVYMIDGVIVIDCCGKVIFINMLVEKMFCVKYESVNGCLIIDVLDIGDMY